MKIKTNKDGRPYEDVKDSNDKTRNFQQFLFAEVLAVQQTPTASEINTAAFDRTGPAVIACKGIPPANFAQDTKVKIRRTK